MHNVASRMVRGARWIAVIGGLCIAVSAQAAIIGHLDAASWAAAAGAPNTSEDFSGFGVDTSLVPNPVLLAGGMSLQVDPDTFDVTFESLIRATLPVGAGVDGSEHASIRLAEVNATGASTTMRLDFANGATAWGADFAGLGGVGGGTFVLDVYDVTDSVLGTVDPASLALGSGGGAGFIGFNATGGDIASYLVFSMPIGGLSSLEAFAMDNLRAVTLTAPVPAPGGLILLVLGLVGVSFSRRKTK